MERSTKLSKYFENLEDRVVCTLCPRKCNLKEGKHGFCEVRQNLGGKLFNLNHGLCTHEVIEPIETNAVFHFFPGENALSLGSIGCNLECDYCQAWRYSHVESAKKRYFEQSSSENIVKSAKNNGIPALAWTFNDPMSFFEFVLDTAKLAKKENIVSIFKSNHFVNEKPLRNLAEYVDIFSISIKSINPEFYKNVCKGQLEPVLKSAKLLREIGKHVEISNLVVPTLNDDRDSLVTLVNWVKDNLGSATPLHFARFHPDYKLKDLPRTTVESVELAREIAMDIGMKYVYCGNVFTSKGLNTYCHSCKHPLIERSGGRTLIINKNERECENCGAEHNITFSDRGKHGESEAVKDVHPSFEEIDKLNKHEHVWSGEIWSTHLAIRNNSNSEHYVIVSNVLEDSDIPATTKLRVGPKETIRYAINRFTEKNTKTIFSHDREVEVRIYDNFDRAYYSLGEKIR